METICNTQKVKSTNYLDALSKEGLLYDPRQHRGDGETRNHNNVQLDLNVRNYLTAYLEFLEVLVISDKNTWVGLFVINL